MILEECREARRGRNGEVVVDGPSSTLLRYRCVGVRAWVWPVGLYARICLGGGAETSFACRALALGVRTAVGWLKQRLRQRCNGEPAPPLPRALLRPAE